MRHYLQTPSAMKHLSNSKQIDFEMDCRSPEVQRETGLSENELGVSASWQSKAQIGNGFGYWAKLPRRSLGESGAPAKLAEGEELGSNLLRVAQSSLWGPSGHLGQKPLGWTLPWHEDLAGSSRAGSGEFEDNGSAGLEGHPKGTGPNWTYGALDSMPRHAGVAIAHTLIASVYGRWALAD